MKYVREAAFWVSLVLLALYVGDTTIITNTKATTSSPILHCIDYITNHPTNSIIDKESITICSNNPQKAYSCTFRGTTLINCN